MDINKILRHQTYLARLETQGFNSFITPSLGETLRNVRAILADIEDISSERQLRRLEREITRVIREQNGWSALNSELDDLADYENRFYASMLTGAAAANQDAVRKMAESTMMVLRAGERFDSGMWPEFVAANIDNQARRVNGIVRAGYAQGMTGREMRRRISNLFDGEISRNAEALARTGYTHFATVGRRALIEENSDIITREVPLVTFDSRTSDTCLSIGARYGQKGWPAGQSPIGYSPWHWKCRSTVVPLTRGEDLLDGKRSARGAEGGTQIDADTTIDEFFNQQPREWIEDALGKERAALFLDGKLELRNLTSARLEPLTLAEIRARGG